MVSILLNLVVTILNPNNKPMVCVRTGRLFRRAGCAGLRGIRNVSNCALMRLFSTTYGRPDHQNSKSRFLYIKKARQAGGRGCCFQQSPTEYFFIVDCFPNSVHNI